MLTVCAVFASLGCAYSTVGLPASTLGAGNTTMSVQPVVVLPAGLVPVILVPVVSVDTGVTDRLDAGMRATWNGIVVRGKLGLVDSRYVAVSIMPSLSVQLIGDHNFLVGYAGEASLSLLLGFRPGFGEILLAATGTAGKYVGFLPPRTDEPGAGVYAAGGLGWLLPLSDGFGLFPEVAVSVPVVGVGLNQTPYFLDFTLGFVFH